MPDNRKNTLFLSFCGIIVFVLGASAGFYFSEKIASEKIEVPEIEPQVKVVTKIEHQEAIPPDDTELQNLRDKIAELEVQLAEQTEMPNGGMGRRGRGGPGNRFGQQEQPQGENTGPRPQMMNFKERMEKMKEENPERYEAMMKHFAEMKEHRKTESLQRKEFFGSVDTSRMSAEQKENHTALLNAISIVDSYQERLGPESEQPLSEEERGEFWNAQRQMRSLLEGERNYILSELGKDCGINGDEFVEYIDTVYSQTGGRFGRRSQPPPPPPPPDR